MKKIIVVSDIHLTQKFEKNKYLKLKKIFEKADQVILNGDFWDGYLVSFDEFINSNWKKLFPLLQKKAIYIFGNHDQEKFINQNYKLFSKKLLKNYTFDIGNLKIKIEHGHDKIKSPDLIYTFIQKFKIIFLVNNLIHKFLANLMGEKYFLTFKKENNEIKRKKRDKNKWLITGHTHYAEIDDQKKYANSGIFNYGFAQYLEIDKNGIKLIKEKY